MRAFITGATRLGTGWAMRAGFGRVIVGLLLLSGCASPHARNGKEITRTTKEFLRAAARGDTLTLRGLSQGDQPRRFAGLHGSRRALLLDAANGLKLRGLYPGKRDSRMLAFFSFTSDGAVEKLSVSVRPVAESWVVTSVFLDSEF
ncbi:hypothetical protein [Longimicrobium terrae]|uniref:Lipoprotein n=1 Tax=Longimicrobium terrae TaxID=1639882 RepID=A0A841H4J6_9BACT|nr:hypothetical protein [Longimicrobium terrae]MBB4638748.1 hypothetical protein [Longimicrobium terrae]MBB6072987.1 hypothetical protein [Longimicrobium terrae]NNC33111.1 hypothetical protein [Longimicrobium terrae]